MNQFMLSSLNRAANLWPSSVIRTLLLSSLLGVLLAGRAVAFAQLTAVNGITTVAGNGTAGFSGDNGPGTSAEVHLPALMAADASGNIYFADEYNQRVRKLAPDGTITTVAGNGVDGSTGIGGLATNAELSYPYGVAVDTAGNLYIDDSSNFRILKVSAATGIITMVAGNGTNGHSGDGGLATSAQIGITAGIAVDSAGNLYLSEPGFRIIRKVTAATGVISTITHYNNAVCGDTGDGGYAVDAEVCSPQGLAVDKTGNLYFADAGHSYVRRIDTNGIITTVAGTGTEGFSGDGGPATSAQLYQPSAVAFDASGNLYIVDHFNSRIRVVVAGIITTVAGGASGGFSGDGGPATGAGLTGPIGIAFDPSGQMYISDTFASRIRKIGPFALPATAIGSSSTQNLLLQTTAAETISSFSVPVSQGGSQEYTVGTVTGCTVDGVTSNASGAICILPITFSPAYPGFRPAPLLATTSTGQVTVGLNGLGVGPLAALTPGLISTYAGNGTAGRGGDGGPATSASVNVSNSMALDSAGNLYVADIANNDVRMISGSTGSITTVAGTGTAGFLGDGGAATVSQLNQPQGVGLDSAGNIYIADSLNARIRKVTAATGIITTVVGDGTRASNGDNGPSNLAEINTPFDVKFDSNNNMFIDDAGADVVRRVDAATGIITTFAGISGTAGYSGDGGPATSAALHGNRTLALDIGNNVYIGDSGNNVVRKVTAGTGIITTIAGNGTPGFSGDGGPAISAELNGPYGLASDSAGDLYIVDSNSNRIRRVTAATGIIDTIAGDGKRTNLVGSDGGPATAADLGEPEGLALDSSGNLYIGDSLAARIRKVNVSASALNYPTATPVGSADSSDDPQTATLLNIGNGPLTIPVPTAGSNPAISSGFALDSSATCPQLQSTDSAAVLGSGIGCTLAVDFTPATDGPNTGTLVETNNSAGVTSTQTISLSGTGIAVAGSPAASFSPTALSFTTVANTSAPNQTVVLTNTGTASLTLTSIGISGTNASSFSIVSNGCGATLAASASCNITIALSTVAVGTYSAQLIATDNASPTTQAVALSGTVSGVPQASLSPTTLTFPNTTVGASSAAQIATLTNSGSGTLNITAITLGGANGTDFAQMNNCGPSLAAGSSCTINVTFAPLSNAGSETATLTVHDDANGTTSSTQAVALSATSTGLTATLSPSLYAFGSVPQSGSASINFTLTNTSDVGLSISSIQLANEPTNSYSYTTTCGTTLAANTACGIIVTFKPSTVGDTTTTLTIRDGAGTQSASLAGTGAPPLTLTPVTYSFGNVAVNSPASYAQFTVTNHGSAAVAIASIGVSPSNSPFVAGNSCPATLAGGASCTISVSFTPATAGAASCTLTVKDGSGNVVSAAISGTGVTPTATVTPAAYVFPDTQVGKTVTTTFTLTNTTAAPLSFTAVNLTSGTQDTEIEPTTNNCPATLQTGATCTVTVRFSPVKVGLSDAALEITDGAGTQVASVSGTGTQPLAVSPANYDFGNVLVGASASTTFTLSNISSVTVTGIALSPPNGSPAYSTDFTTTTTCGSSLAVNSSCTYTVTFQPSGAHVAQSYLNISDDGGTLTPGVSGTGVAPTARLTPATFVFPNTQVGGTATATFTLTNTSSGPISFKAVNLTSGTQDTEIEPVANNCPASLQAGTACTITVRFSPVKVGLSDAALEVTDGAGTQIASVSGTGTQPLAISPSSYDFGNVPVGSSAVVTFTLYNASSITVPVSLLPPSGAVQYGSDFSVSSTCGSSLAANASCSYTVTFQPSGVHVAQSYLNISDDGGSLTPGLSGTGIAAPDFSVSTTASNVQFSSGGHATISVTVASALASSPFTGVVSLTASGLPVGTTYTFTQSAVSPGSSPQTVDLEVQLPATASLKEMPLQSLHQTGVLAAGAPFIGLLFTFIRRRNSANSVRLYSFIIGALCLLFAAIGMSGCGAPPSRAPTVSSTLTITGMSGNISHSTSVLVYYTQR